MSTERTARDQSLHADAVPAHLLVVLGATSAIVPGFALPGWASARLAANERALVDTLGEEEFATRSDRGATLGAEGAFAYICAEAARILGEGAAS